MTKHLNSEVEESDIAISFSKYAQSYDRHAILQNMMAKRLALFLPDEIHNRVLEIGCGTGLFTKHLIELEPKKLILNDISIEMVKKLKEKTSLPNYTEILVGDAETIKIEAVDIITANAVFQWFKSPEESLIHLSSFIKPGGKMIFSTFGAKTLDKFRQIFAIESPASLISFNKWKKIIKSAGLTLESYAINNHKALFNNTLSLLKNLQQLGAAPYRVTPTGELRRLIRQYDDNNSTEHGITVNWELYYFLAINKQ